MMEKLRVRVSDDLSTRPGKEWLEDIRSAARNTAPLKEYGDKSSTRTYRVRLEEAGSVWLKEYRFRSRGRQFLSFFRQSRAARVWWISAQLRSCGCEVPKPLVMIDLRFAGVLRESYLATEWLEGRRSLQAWFRSVEGRPDDAWLNDDTILRAVRAAAGFHRHGAIHGDMKWSNFMLPPGSGGEIILIDLDATRFDSRPAARGKDLARFAISAIEHGLSVDIMDRVFDIYCGNPRPPQAGRIRKAFEGYVRKKLPHKFQ